MLTLFLLSIFATLSYGSPIGFDKADPIASDPEMMSLVNGIFERNVRRGLANPNTLHAEDRENILNLHNKIRSETARGLYQGSGQMLPQSSNMAELKYSLNLEKVATEWSDACNFEHRGGSNNCADAIARFKSQGYEPEWPNYSAASGCGENLYGSGADPAWTSVFGDADYGIRGGIEDSWCIGEAKTWTYQNGMGSAGHYTQVVWDTSRYVGCGFRQCSAGWMKTMFTCNYYPAGNGFFGGREGPYARGTPCSACPSDIPNCTSGDRPGLCTDGGSAATTTTTTTTTTARPTTTTSTTTSTTSSTASTASTASSTTSSTTASTASSTTSTSTTTTSTTANGQCLTIAAFSGAMQVMNGEWSLSSNGDWTKGTFALSNVGGYFGFFNSAAGENYPNWDTYGWCQASEIAACSNIAWRTRSGAAAYSPAFTNSAGSCSGTTSSTSSTSSTSASPVVDEHACIQIEQLDVNAVVDGNYVSLNEGQWTPIADFNNYRAYEWSEGSYYLYALEYYNWYTIGPQLGAMQNLKGWCGSQQGVHIDILGCDGKWDLNGMDSNSIFKSCGSGALNFAPCLDDAAENMCFYENSTVAEPQTFGLYEDEGCLGGEAVYAVNVEDEDKYYIHYDAEFSMWKISVDVVEGNALFVCGAESLSECVEGTWIKLVNGFGISSFEAMEGAKMEACEADLDGVVVGDGDGDSKAMSMEIMVVLIVGVVVLLLLFVAAVVFCRNKRMRGEVAFNHKDIKIEEKTGTADGGPMTTNEYEDAAGDVISVGTDDEAEIL